MGKKKKIVCQEVMTEKKARREKNIPDAKGDKKCVLLHPECNILVMEKYESIKNWLGNP